MISWLVRQVRLHPVRSGFLSIAAGAIGFYWVAPLVAASYFVPVVGLCMLGGVMIGGAINWLSNTQRSSQLPVSAQPLTNTKEQEFKREVPSLLKQREKWIIYKLRSSGLDKAVQSTLIQKLERELAAERLVNEEWLHDWVRQNLNQDLTRKILRDWLQLTEKDAFQVFKLHLTRKPAESKRSVAHCFKLLNNDFKPMMGIIESFLTPTMDEETFNREIRKAAGGLLGNFVRLAREGKLNYVKYALPKIDPSKVQEMLPAAIEDAAKNGYLEMVKYLVGLLKEGEEEITENLFEIALRENHTKMFIWLLQNYDDKQLKSKERPDSNIHTQIRFFNAQHNDVNSSPHPLVEIYNAIRKVNVLASSREVEFKKDAAVPALRS